MKKDSQLKVVLIGPVLPYRSGIAQYNTQLHKALRKTVNLQTLSFKRQYPPWLFPGKSDIEEGMEDYRETGVKYLIDVYNPLSLRKAADIVDPDCSLVILNWWTLFWQPGFAYISHRLRKRGIKSVFLCHNLFDHDAKGLKRTLSEIFIKQADGYIVQASEQKQMLKEMNPQAKILQKIHPIYTHFPSPDKQLPKRGKLELLFFGFIRPYKGLDVLIRAMELLNDNDIYLTIVGEHWGKSDELLKKIDCNTNIEAKLEYVSDKEAAAYFSRADVVVLPYLSATGSGVVTLAYNYVKPVLATNVGGLVDAVVDGKTGWLIPKNSPKKLAFAINKINRAQAKEMRVDIKNFCDNNSWDGLAKAIINLSNEMSRT